jgi:fucose-1-phosphate guanylyltransferase
LPAGPNATAEYTHNTENVTKVNDDLVSVRRKIFEQLKGTPLNVLVFNSSKFYHIGTIDEYLEHYSSGSAVMRELGGTSQVLTARYFFFKN